MFSPKTLTSEHRDLIHDVAFDIYGNRMATCSSDQTIKVWDVGKDGDWKQTSSWKAHSGSVWKVTWAHPEFGQVLASCSFDRTAAVWEEIVGETNTMGSSGYKHWAKRTNLVDSRTSVMDIKFAPKSMGLLLATCSADGIIRIYEAPDVMNLAQWTLQQEVACKHQASCISWNPSYTREKRCTKSSFVKPQVSGDKKDELKSEDSENNGTNGQKNPFSSEKNDKMVILPQVPLLAVGCDEFNCSSNNRIVILHYLSLVRRWNKIDCAVSVSDPVHDLAFAPRLGRSFDLLAIATKDIKLLTIYQIMASSGAIRFEVSLTATFEDHFSTIWRVSWNSIGSILASTGDDGSVRMWKQCQKSVWKSIAVIKGDGHIVKSKENQETVNNFR